MNPDSAWHLLLIETASNQRYIYDTNKLRDNIGASELLLRATTHWVDKTLAGLSEGVDYTRVVQLAGKAILLVRDPDHARRIIRAVTLRALREAPGMVVRGVVGDAPIDPDVTTSGAFHAALKALFAAHERLGAELPAPDARLLRLPVVAPCGRSGLPAGHLVRRATDEVEALSAPSLAKERCAEAGWSRIVKSLRDIDPTLTFYRNVTKLEEANTSMAWVGLIHADGNGLGQLFMNFDNYVGRETPARDYIKLYRDFSQALDRCTQAAFAGALGDLAARWRAAGSPADAPLPVVPMVLGGDDLTVLVEGTMAPRLAADFMTHFMKKTAADPAIQAVWEGPLGVCAGVALVKPHYPHHAAYEMACDLMDSAKAGKWVFRNGTGILPYAALDLHVHLDSAGDALGPVRARMRSRDGSASLTVRPFVVRVPDGAPAPALDWAKHRRWDWLETVMPVMPRGGGGDGDEDDPRLPSSVLHDLRAAALDGVEVADARLRAVLGREHKDAPRRVREGWARLLDKTDPGTATLFVDVPAEQPGAPERATRLLDALDLMDFWR